MTTVEPGTRVSEGMGGLAKGLKILEAFPNSDGRLTVSDAARVAKTSRASARRCLLTLSELGYLQFDGKFFRLQPRILSLARGYTDSDPLPRVGQPILSAARDLLGESVSLAVLDNDTAFFIARAEAERLVSSSVTVGARSPAYCSSTGRVLLAGLTDGQVLAYLERTDIVALTKFTQIGKNEIFAIVRKARDDGYAVSDEEMELGLLSISVPVYDSRRLLVGAMSASASSARIRSSALTKNFLPVLIEHAAKLGRAL